MFDFPDVDQQRVRVLLEPYPLSDRFARMVVSLNNLETLLPS